MLLVFLSQIMRIQAELQACALADIAIGFQGQDGFAGLNDWFLAQ